MKKHLFKKLFRAIMDEVLPDNISSLAATVKEVTTEDDGIPIKTRVNKLNKKIFEEPDIETIPKPHLMSDKEINIVDLDNIYVINRDLANSTYGTQRYARKKSKLKNISNEENGESEEE